MKRFDVSGFVYAHRGLWSETAPENSLAAFHAARRAAVGVELDARSTRDGVVVVFHDSTLMRMCGVDARLNEVSLSELKSAHLPDGSPVPTLEQALGALKGLPVLVELKANGPDDRAIADAAAHALRRHEGLFAAMSFDEGCVARLCQSVPERPVGLLIDALDRIGPAAIAEKAARARAMGCDFIGPHLSSLKAAAEAGGGLPMATWTARTAEDVAAARRRGAAPIFEAICPDLAKGRERPI